MVTFQKHAASRLLKCKTVALQTCLKNKIIAELLFSKFLKVKIEAKSTILCKQSGMKQEVGVWGG